MSRNPATHIIDLTATAATSTGVTEASGIVTQDGQDFFLVDDEAGVFALKFGESGKRLKIAEGMRDLEGIAAIDEHQLFVLSERSGKVWAWRRSGPKQDWEPDRQPLALPKTGKKKNRGWEGICYSPTAPGRAAASISGPVIVAAHQRKPRIVCVQSVDGETKPLTFTLGKGARQSLSDLNDIAVHPSTGDVWLLSGKSSLVAQLELGADGLELRRLYRTHGPHAGVLEGMCFDRTGGLWMVSDGDGMLLRFELPS